MEAVRITSSKVKDPLTSERDITQTKVLSSMLKARAAEGWFAAGQRDERRKGGTDNGSMGAERREERKRKKSLP